MPKQSVKTSKKAPHRLPKKTATAKVPKKSTVAVEPPVVAQTRSVIPSAFVLARQTAVVLWEHRRLFITISLIYGVLNVLMVRGLSGGANVTELKHELNSFFTGNLHTIASGLSIFVVLVGSSGNSSSQTAGAYQLFLGLIVSLALIWSLRHVVAGKMVEARDAFYHGMYPLIPFILVLLVLGLQLIPLILGAAVYSTVLGNGIAVHLIEQIIWGALFAIFAGLTIYMLIATVFALYVVTLPDMTPRKALRTAKQLVAGRRLLVLRKILFLPLALLVVSAVIMVPIIIVLTPLAQWIFFILTMFGLAIIHSYMYLLYRELLDD